jgi:dihydrofolate reductase
MLVSLIAAMDRRGLIGDERGLPWHLPKDLRRFREYTWGKPIIMGRTTFELIGRPLPGRLNIVLTPNPEYSAPGCQVARSLDKALALAADHLAASGGDEAVIIGGAKVYAEAIGRCDRLYLTVVDGEFEGTAYFPVCEALRQTWRTLREPETHPPDEKNPHGHSFYILVRAWEVDANPHQVAAGNLTLAPANAGKVLDGLDLADILARGTMGREVPGGEEVCRAPGRDDPGAPSRSG